MTPAIVPMTRELLDVLAPRVRLHDAEAVEAAFGLTAADMLRESAARSVYVWAGLIDGEPICAFGLIAESLVSDRATAWLIATPEVERHRVTFWRHCRPVVAAMRARFPVLIAQCQENFPRSLAWLERLGFRVMVGAEFRAAASAKRAAPGVPFLQLTLTGA